MNDERLLRAQEVLFYADCQLEGMKAENKQKEFNGLAPMYREDAFIQLAEQTRGQYRRAIE